jgi:hypothetical protein
MPGLLPPVGYAASPHACNGVCRVQAHQAHAESAGTRAWDYVVNDRRGVERVPGRKGAGAFRSLIYASWGPLSPVIESARPLLSCEGVSEN